MSSIFSHGAAIKGRPRLRQSWNNALFLHWAVPLSQLRPLVPSPLEIATHDGRAFATIIAANVTRSRGGMAPIGSSFRQLAVRTYVNCQGAVGIWYLGINVSSGAGERAAAKLGLPAKLASVRFVSLQGSGFDVALSRDGASAHVVFEPKGELRQRDHLASFLVDPQLLFTVSDGSLIATDMRQGAFGTRDAELKLLDETLLRELHILRPAGSPLMHAVRSVEVEYFGSKRIGSAVPR